MRKWLVYYVWNESIGYLHQFGEGIIMLQVFPKCSNLTHRVLAATDVYPLYKSEAVNSFQIQAYLPYFKFENI